MKTQVHSMTVMVVDFDRLGSNEAVMELENGHFANDCVNPRVMDVKTREVDWDDEHPLNKPTTFRAEYERMFPVSVTEQAYAACERAREVVTDERDAALARANAAEASLRSAQEAFEAGAKVAADTIKDLLERVKKLDDMRRDLEGTIMGMGAESSTRADVIRGLRAQLDAHKRALDEALFSGDARRAPEDSDTHVWRNHIRALAGGKP